MKKNKWIVWFVLFISLVTVIEGGIRIAVWLSIKKLVPPGATYSLNIARYKNLDRKTGCLISEENDYLYFFYTPWILTRVQGGIICRHQSAHIELLVITEDKYTRYHWSFYKLSFLKDFLN
ncbi:hypothetical protein [Rahnella laticis]|uniref:hypothetical protein n=1 Tax=Rahnella laticis TaxID=2787622 RepID=UPI0018A257AB|nr:hypothetical protein [Rahnella laticis]MBF7993932.1 hypothetical protein [Rahnella laticis]